MLNSYEENILSTSPSLAVRTLWSKLKEYLFGNSLPENKKQGIYSKIKSLLNGDVNVDVIESTLQALMGDVANEIEELGRRTGLESLSGLINKSSVVARLGAAGVATSGIEAAQHKARSIESATGLEKIKSDSINAITGFGDVNAENISSRTEQFGRAASTLQMELGVSTDVADKQVRDFIIAFKGQAAEVEKIKLTTDVGEDGQATKTLTGAESLAVLSKGLNIDSSTAANYMRTATRELGVSLDDARDSLIAFNRDAVGTGFVAEDFTNLITDATSGTKGLGDQSRAASADFSRFLRVFKDTGNVDAAANALKNVYSQISQMNLETKAFLGMTSSIGQGSGALGSSLRMEEAIASKDSGALEQIRKDIVNQVEQLSGSKVMTRQEAIASGQEQTYTVQRMIGEQLGLGGGQNYDLIIRGEKQLGEQLADVQAVTASDQANVAANARAISAAENGPLVTSLNRMEGLVSLIASQLTGQAVQIGQETSNLSVSAVRSLNPTGTEDLSSFDFADNFKKLVDGAGNLKLSDVLGSVSPTIGGAGALSNQFEMGVGSAGLGAAELSAATPSVGRQQIDIQASSSSVAYGAQSFVAPSVASQIPEPAQYLAPSVGNTTASIEQASASTATSKDTESKEMKVEFTWAPGAGSDIEELFKKVINAKLVLAGGLNP